MFSSACGFRSWAGPVTNDFSTQVDFSRAVIAGPGLDQVELHTYYQDGSIFYTVYDRSSGFNAHVWDGGSVLGLRGVAGDSGTFRITRAGATVTGYFDGAALASRSRPSPLVAVDFVLQNNSGSDDAISVTFDNFSLTADSIPPLLGMTIMPGASAQFTWTTNSAGYKLQQSATLTPPDWTVVPGEPEVSGGNFVLRLEAAPPQRFFRLRR